MLSWDSQFATNSRECRAAGGMSARSGRAARGSGVFLERHPRGAESQEGSHCLWTGPSDTADAFAGEG